jgi:ribonuclease BN (tRNA processing enzyme)
MSLETCKEFLQANDLSQVKDIALIHLSDSNSDAERFKREDEGLTGKPTYIASKGLEIEL